MVLIEFGIFISFKLLHPANALFPIEVTKLRISTFFKFLHVANANGLIEVTDPDTITSFISKFPSKDTVPL
ncbi:hypothetical protein CLOBAR_02010 [Intestinibacter bartlettii DSM 16795]|nr:hypothetical protein CLOBAR_02010 [Intestinibacter bartlettii DSM 16795]